MENINNTKFTLKRVEQVELLKRLLYKVQELKHKGVMDIQNEILTLEVMALNLTNFNSKTCENSFIGFLEAKAIEEVAEWQK
jgi:hypothetical protein